MCEFLKLKRLLRWYLLPPFPIFASMKVSLLRFCSCCLFLPSFFCCGYLIYQLGENCQAIDFGLGFTEYESGIAALPTADSIRCFFLLKLSSPAYRSLPQIPAQRPLLNPRQKDLCLFNLAFRYPHQYCYDRKFGSLPSVEITESWSWSLVLRRVLNHLFQTRELRPRCSSCWRWGLRNLYVPKRRYSSSFPYWARMF